MNTRTILLMMLLAGRASVTQAQADSIPPPSDCTVELQSGKKIAVDRFWQLAGDKVEYEIDGSLHDLTTAEIRTIRCSGLAYTIINDTLRPAEVSTSMNASKTPSTPVMRLDGSIDYRAMGKADAKLHYGGEGNFVAGMLTAPLLIPPLVIASVPPTPSLKNNPNAHLYYTQPEYRKGYRGVAHGKKAGLTIGGMTVGLVLFAMIAAASA